MSLHKVIIAVLVATLAAMLLTGPAWAEGQGATPGMSPPAPAKQSAELAQQKSAGCIGCHSTTDSSTMHTSPGVILGCADCHGGNPAAFVPQGAQPGSAEYRRALDAAHVQPRHPAAWNYPS